MNAIRIFVLLFALTCVADAQVPMTGAGLGSGYAYAGLGDLITGVVFEGGTRAYSSATRGQKALNVCNVGDAACADLSTDSITGALTISTIGGESCSVAISSGTYVTATGAIALVTATGSNLVSGSPFALSALTGTGSVASLNGSYTATTGTTGTTIHATGATGLGTITITGGVVSVCTVKTIYDQTDNGNNFLQSTIANRATLVVSCVNSKPCLQFAAGQFYQINPGFNGGNDIAQPLTLIGTVYTTNVAHGGIISGETGIMLDITDLYSDGAGNIGIYGGGSSALQQPAASSVWHSAIGLIDGSTSMMSIDGTGASDVAVGSAGFYHLYVTLGTNSYSQQLTGYATEFAIVSGGVFPKLAAALTYNQAAYWPAITPSVTVNAAVATTPYVSPTFGFWPWTASAGSLYVDGSWSTGPEAWNIGGYSVTDVVTINPTTFPAGTVLTWTAPSTFPSGGNVYAYPNITYGLENGTSSTPCLSNCVTPKQINSFNNLSVTYNVTRSFSDNDSDVMFETETYASGSGTNEISFFPYIPSYFVSYALGLSDQLNYSAGGFNARISRSGAGDQILIWPVTAPNGTTALDLSSGTQTWPVLAIMQFLVAQGWISGTDYSAGFAFGAEVGKNNGLVTINNLNWTWNFLLKRDLDPASNDNTPAWLNEAA